MKKEFIDLLKSLHLKLDPLFSKYLEDENSIDSSENMKDLLLKTIDDKNIALISANSSKKKLKNIGIDPRNVIVTGGPINANDYKEINTNLPEKALEGIKKKIERIFNEIKKEDWIKKNLVFFYEQENLTDKLIVKRINEISNLIGKEVILKKINSWKDLDI